MLVSMGGLRCLLPMQRLLDAGQRDGLFLLLAWPWLQDLRIVGGDDLMVNHEMALETMETALGVQKTVGWDFDGQAWGHEGRVG